MKKKVLIVCADYYWHTTLSLKVDAENILDKANIKHHSMHVPGIFEIPVVISKNIKKYDGFIALGCVIKGETPHFDFISRATTDAIMKLSIEHQKPIGNGIITCLNKKQALVRSKTKGQEAAKAVLSVLKSFENPPE